MSSLRSSTESILISALIKSNIMIDLTHNPQFFARFGRKLIDPFIEFIEPVPAEASSSSTSSALEDIEREHIIRVLRETKGKIGGPGGAAERLGMNRTTLNSRMQKLKIFRQQV